MSDGTDSHAARAPRPPHRHEQPNRVPLVRVLKYFMVLLAISVGFAVIAAGLLATEHDGRRYSAMLRVLTNIFEVILSLTVLVAWFRLPAAPSPAVSGYKKLIGWALGIPLLAAALAINFAYHAMVMNYIRPPEWMTDEALYRGATVPWLIATICIQPAIFEELFFRRLTLDHLRTEMSGHTAVWVSSMMFGLAHLGTPLSIPALIVVGVSLGYARLWSGSLLLPMLMHALHNGVVVFMEVHR